MLLHVSILRWFYQWIYAPFLSQWLLIACSALVPALQLFEVCLAQCGIALLSICLCPGLSSAPDHLDFPCLNLGIHHTFVVLLAG